jgi:hypothetical protein
MLLEATFQLIVIDDKTPGFNQTIVEPPKPKVVDPIPIPPRPIPLAPEPITPPKLTIKVPGLEPIIIDSTRVEQKQNYIKTQVPFPNFGGGTFGGGGAGGGF